MKRLFVYLLVFWVLFAPLAFSETPPVFRLTVSKVWSIEDARDEAFLNAPLQADVSGYAASDPGFGANQGLRRQGGGYDGKGQLMTVFNDGGYCIKNAQKTQRLYYSAEGRLEAVQFLVGDGFPNKSYKYSADARHRDRQGQLVSVGIQVREDESFIFAADGSLIGHWIGEQCYRADGSSCGTRKKLDK